MRPLSLWLSFLSTAILLAGCDAQVARIQESANHIRIGLEQMDRANRAVDENREAQIFADGQAFVRKNDQLTGMPAPESSANYALRRDGAGWSIIDLRTQQPVHRSGHAAKGLPLSKARNMLDNLESDPDPTGSYTSHLPPPRQ
jgi:hypothetical protein